MDTLCFWYSCLLSYLGCFWNVKMNERIQELATQCNVWFGEGSVDYFGEKHPPFIETRFMNLEKFSNLLIWECISELEKSKRCDPYTGELFNCEHNDVIDCQIEILKEHFGIEG